MALNEVQSTAFEPKVKPKRITSDLSLPPLTDSTELPDVEFTANVFLVELKHVSRKIVELADEAAEERKLGKTKRFP